jgi:hypothetical protein
MAARTTHGEHFEAFSIQNGAYITITDLETGQSIKIDPLVLRELLYTHTEPEYFDLMDEPEQPYSEHSKQLAKELRAKALNLVR